MINGGEKIKKVILKFYFTNEKLLPSGIRIVPREEARIVMMHFQQGRALGLPNGGAGRIREDNVDTGNYITLQKTSISHIWEQLKQTHYVSDIHCYLKPGMTNKKQKYVISVTFAFPEDIDKKINFKNSLVREIEKTFVQESEWGFVHIWTNPDGTVTVNCVQRTPKPKNTKTP